MAPVGILVNRGPIREFRFCESLKMHRFLFCVPLALVGCTIGSGYDCDCRCSKDGMQTVFLVQDVCANSSEEASKFAKAKKCPDPEANNVGCTCIKDPTKGLCVDSAAAESLKPIPDLTVPEQ